MRTLLWMISLVLGLPAALLIALNWLGFLGWTVESVQGKRHDGFSFCPPFLCGVAGAVALLVCPHPGVWRLAWTALVLDPSLALLFAALVLHLVARVGRYPSPFDPDPTSGR